MIDFAITHTNVRPSLSIALVLLCPYLTQTGLCQNAPVSLDHLASPSSNESVIRLPIRFHIVPTVLKKDGIELQMWIKPKDVTDALLPEVNRIWKPAKIEWFVEQVVVQNPPAHPDIQQTLRGIAAADRSTRGRTRMVMSLAEPQNRHPVIHNVYFVPFVGSTSQGFANFGGSTSILFSPDGGNRCYVGVWTDKPSRGQEPPRKFPLVEPLPFKFGSIARTVSHELGHTLLLQHPDPKTQKEHHRLMGGMKQGYRLLDHEIATARRVAAFRVLTINHWIDRNPSRHGKSDPAAEPADAPESASPGVSKMEDQPRGPDDR